MLVRLGEAGRAGIPVRESMVQQPWRQPGNPKENTKCTHSPFGPALSFLLFSLADQFWGLQDDLYMRIFTATTITIPGD